MNIEFVVGPLDCLLKFFSRVAGFPLFKNQHLNIPVQSGMHIDIWTSSEEHKHSKLQPFWSSRWVQRNFFAMICQAIMYVLISSLLWSQWWWNINFAGNINFFLSSVFFLIHLAVSQRAPPNLVVMVWQSFWLSIYLFIEILGSKSTSEKVELRALSTWVFCKEIIEGDCGKSPKRLVVS